MSLSLSTQDCEASFHRLIQSLARQDREEARHAWRAWQVARAELADHQKKATESANTQTSRVIGTYLGASSMVLEGDRAALLAGYPHYLAARNELFKLVGGDGLLYALARNSAPVLDAATLKSMPECDFRAVLDGMSRQGDSPLSRRRAVAL